MEFHTSESNWMIKWKSARISACPKDFDLYCPVLNKVSMTSELFIGIVGTGKFIWIWEHSCSQKYTHVNASDSKEILKNTSKGREPEQNGMHIVVTSLVWNLNTFYERFYVRNCTF